MSKMLDALVGQMGRASGYPCSACGREHVDEANAHEPGGCCCKPCGCYRMQVVAAARDIGIDPAELTRRRLDEEVCHLEVELARPTVRSDC